MEPTQQQLANRQAAASGQPVNVQNQPSQGLDPNVFLSQLQEQMMKSSDIVSSGSSGISEMIQKAISGVTTAKEATAGRIESQFGREIGYTQDAAKQQMTSALEARRGFATNTAAMKQLEESTNKQINDLEQRKQELLLANDAQAAQQLTNLQVQAYQFEQDARQQYFTNTLGLAQFGASLMNMKSEIDARTKNMSLQEKQMALQEKRLEFDQAQALDNRLLKRQELELMKRKVDAELGSFDNVNFKNIQDQNIVNSVVDSVRSQVYQQATSQGLDENEIRELFMTNALQLAATYGGAVNTDPVQYFVDQFGVDIAEEQQKQIEEDQELVDIFSVGSSALRGVGNIMNTVGTFFGGERIADYFDKTRIR